MWVQLLIWVIVTLISWALMPKPQNAKPAHLEDFQVPTAEDGRTIPWLFGTRDVPDPNCVWYGHLKSKAITAKGGKK